MTHPVIERRRRERAALIERARAYAEALSDRVSVRSAVVFGSVARGDWNKWSDIDVLVVADALPDDVLRRLDLLLLPDHPGVQPVGWTPADLAARRDHDPILAEARTIGVAVFGEALR